MVVLSFWANINCWGWCDDLVARNALKRKKQHEHSLEQTNGQINMLEQQIYSIESANINQETLLAMKNASAAMKHIHGRMTMEDVDVTMYVLRPDPSFLPHSSLLPPSFFHHSIKRIRKTLTLVFFLGNNSANNTNSRKKSATQSPRCRLRNRLMKMNYRPTWTN